MRLVSIQPIYFFNLHDYKAFSITARNVVSTFLGTFNSHQNNDKRFQLGENDHMAYECSFGTIN